MSCRANQDRDAYARQQALKNDCSQKTDLEQLFGHYGRTSRRSIWRSGSAAASARRTSISPASASLRRAPSSSSWTRSIEFELETARTASRNQPFATMDSRTEMSGALGGLTRRRRCYIRGEQIGQQLYRARAGADHRATFSSDVRSRRFPRGHDPVICRTDVRSFHSSGGGLGIHEPGSMTWGFQRLTQRDQSPSGRARDRAMCPAVARSSSRGRSPLTERGTTAPSRQVRMMGQGRAPEPCGPGSNARTPGPREAIARAA